MKPEFSRFYEKYGIFLPPFLRRVDGSDGCSCDDSANDLSLLPINDERMPLLYIFYTCASSTALLLPYDVIDCLVMTQPPSHIPPLHSRQSLPVHPPLHAYTSCSPIRNEPTFEHLQKIQSHTELFMFHFLYEYDTQAYFQALWTF